ncbi:MULTISPECIES: acyl-CoA carboxylase epsilon subunit [unclassified Streptomyces]|uniref:acyl-CoA carboxylase epsilon subunit n=1 Tax=unclassified Streptomyces TaxID=2593676 RepID=UPI00324873BE
MPSSPSDAPSSPTSSEPLFRVVRGEATESELAALAVVLLALNTPEALPSPVTPVAPWRRSPYAHPISWQEAA